MFYLKKLNRDFVRLIVFFVSLYSISNTTMIINIEPSKVKHKRYCITMDSGKKYNFGLDTGSTYIDHHDPKLRDAYRARHLGSGTEHKLITNLVPSPSLFSYYVLWGPYVTIPDNIRYLNNLWKLQH